MTISKKYTLLRRLSGAACGFALLALFLSVGGDSRTVYAEYKDTFAQRMTKGVRYPPEKVTFANFANASAFPEMRGRLTVDRTGLGTQVEVSVSKLPPPYEVNSRCATYVVWKITRNFGAQRLGELRPPSAEAFDITQRYDIDDASFAIIVTAEPHFDVTRPSDAVILENARPTQNAKGDLVVFGIDYRSRPISELATAGLAQFNKESFSARPPIFADSPEDELIREPFAPSIYRQAQQAMALAKYAGASAQQLSDIESGFIFGLGKAGRRAVAVVSRMRELERAGSDSQKLRQEAKYDLQSPAADYRSIAEGAVAAAARAEQNAGHEYSYDGGMLGGPSGLMHTSSLWSGAHAFRPSGRLVRRFKGVIVSRDDDILTVRGAKGLETKVYLLPNTRLSDGEPNSAMANYSTSDLIRGLNVEVDGRGDSTVLVASKIRFEKGGLMIARTMYSQMSPTATSTSVADQNAQRISGQIDELMAISNAAKAGAKAAQDTADAAVAGVNATNSRISDIEDYEVRSTNSISFVGQSDVLSPAAKTRLDEVATASSSLKGYVIEVRGFINSDAGTAKDLGQRRADAIVSYLVENHNVPLRRITSGFSDLPASNVVSKLPEPTKTAFEISVLTARNLDFSEPVVTTAGEEPSTAELSRYPSIESPRVVDPGTTFSVQVSLSVDRLTKEVVIRNTGETAEKTAVGQVKMKLPWSPAVKSWEIDVVLSSSDDLTIEKPDSPAIKDWNRRTITVSKDGDSTPALFNLSVQPTTDPEHRAQIRATFYNKTTGMFLLTASRDITVKQANTPIDAIASKGAVEADMSVADEAVAGATVSSAAAQVAAPAQRKVAKAAEIAGSKLDALASGGASSQNSLAAKASPPSFAPAGRRGLSKPEPQPVMVQAAQTEPYSPPSLAVMNMDETSHVDLTLTVREREKRADGSRVFSVEAYSSSGTSNTAKWELPSDFPKWIESQFRLFSRGRGSTPVDEGDTPRPTPEAMKDLGEKLYDKFAPPAFKNAFWAARREKGEAFRTIQIITDDPTFPWELVRPRADTMSESLNFLGIDYSIGRLHASGDNEFNNQLQRAEVSGIDVIPPNYVDGSQLKMVSKETAFLRSLTAFSGFDGVREIGPTRQQLKRLLGRKPPHIIHFAGHGSVRTDNGDDAVAEIKLEDAKVTSAELAGMLSRSGKDRPFVFLNACDVGRANKVLNFTDGFAPAVLDSGASGFIGALWAVNDESAEKFAELFYGEMQRELKANGIVSMADLMRKTKADYLKTSDPTFLAYVFYGSPNLLLKLSPSSRKTISKGDLTGRLLLALPPVVYSAAALEAKVTGKVVVYIVVDEEGKVESAKALSGPELLRPLAEAAAYLAQFDPETESDLPMKMNGSLTFDLKP